MWYRVVVKFKTKRMCGKWTSKSQAEKELIFWKEIIKESERVFIETSEEIEA